MPSAAVSRVMKGREPYTGSLRFSLKSEQAFKQDLAFTRCCVLPYPSSSIAKAPYG